MRDHTHARAHARTRTHARIDLSVSDVKASAERSVMANWLRIGNK